jgi:hypothetical protein
MPGRRIRSCSFRVSARGVPLGYAVRPPFPIFDRGDESFDWGDESLSLLILPKGSLGRGTTERSGGAAR